MNEIEIIKAYIKDAQEQIEMFGFGDKEFIKIKQDEIKQWTKDLVRLMKSDLI